MFTDIEHVLDFVDSYMDFPKNLDRSIKIRLISEGYIEKINDTILLTKKGQKFLIKKEEMENETWKRNY